MAIEECPGRIAYGIVGIVALHQHRVEGGDAAAARLAVARPFAQRGNPREDGRRIASGCRNLAYSEPDLALRHGKARQGIHKQEHMLTPIAKKFGDCHGAIRAVDAPQRRGVRGCCHDDCFGQSVFPKRVLDKFFDLAAAFANQPYDHDFGTRVPCHHAQKDTLPEAGSREQPQSRAAANREEGVDRPDPDIERLIDQCSSHRIDRLAEQRRALRTTQLALAVYRQATGVNDAAKQLRANSNFNRVPRGHYASAGGKPVAVTVGHQQDPPTIESNHLRRYQTTCFALDEASLADRRVNAVRLHDETDRTDQAAVDLHGAVVSSDARPIAFEPPDQSRARRRVDHFSSPSNSANMTLRHLEASDSRLAKSLQR